MKKRELVMKIFSITLLLFYIFFGLDLISYYNNFNLLSCNFLNDYAILMSFIITIVYFIITIIYILNLVFLIINIINKIKERKATKSRQNYKSKIHPYILSFLAIVLSIPLIYMCFIQRWIVPVSVVDEQITQLNCLYDKKSDESKFVFENLLEKSEGTSKIYTEEIRKVFEGNKFTRTIFFEDNSPVIEIDYDFKILGDSGCCYVYISTNNITDFKKGLCNYSSIENLENMLSDEIGPFRPIYSLFVNRGSINNINYYITPVMAGNRTSEFYITPYNSTDKFIHSVYEVGEYRIDICEYCTSDDTSKYLDVLNDIGDLLNNATAS